METNYNTMREDIVTSPQAFTTSWVDLGPEIQMFGYNNLGVWLKIDINDTQNARIRARVKLAKDATDEYSLPIKTAQASDVLIEQQYHEFNVDEDASYLIDFDTKGHAAYLQLQISASVAGASAGQITAASITKRYDH